MYSEKRKPHHDLRAFQAAFEKPRSVAITNTALTGAYEIGLGRVDMRLVVQTMTRCHFYKSMTAHGDHQQWQDVYHVPFGDLVLYVKFTDDKLCEFKLLSFKER